MRTTVVGFIPTCSDLRTLFSVTFPLGNIAKHFSVAVPDLLVQTRNSGTKKGPMYKLAFLLSPSSPQTGIPRPANVAHPVASGSLPSVSVAITASG